MKPTEEARTLQPGVFAWRAELFSPVTVAESFNRSLNEAWHDQGNNVSVALSEAGAAPVSWYGGSGAVDSRLLLSLQHAVHANPGAFALIRQGDGPVLEVLGSDHGELTGRGGHFFDLAGLLGLRRVETSLDALLPTAAGGSLLLQALVTPLTTTADGEIIQVVAVPWLEIAAAIERDSAFLSQFAQNPRAFEEFLAGTYDRAGFEEVTLTHRSGDGGRDVIAVKRGFGSVRILDQAKAYSPGHVVTANDVRAIFGVLANDKGASKGALTTTSTFAPRILEEFKVAVPHRLELRDGEDLRRIVSELLRR